MQEVVSNEPMTSRKELELIMKVSTPYLHHYLLNDFHCSLSSKRRSCTLQVYDILFCVVVESYTHISCTCTSFDISRRQCLWKLCRHLPDAINDMDVERSLMHVHHFMKAHPASSWAQRDNDMPLRTVKTIVHTLAKLKGAKVASPPHPLATRSSAAAAHNVRYTHT